MSKRIKHFQLLLKDLLNKPVSIHRGCMLCINTKEPELVIRRLIPSGGKPKVLFWIFGNVSKVWPKLFELTKMGIVPTHLGLLYGARETGLGFRIDITRPGDLHSLCRDLKIRRIRIVSTYLPDV